MGAGEHATIDNEWKAGELADAFGGASQQRILLELAA